MQNHEFLFAGFGGQGILSMGKFLAYAGMDEGFNVSYLPSYGPEMRGGTANCSVIIGKEDIGSPIVTHPMYAAIMNRPSLDKFEKSVLPDGIMILDCSLVNRDVERKDIKVLKLPATEIADGLGDKMAANMVMLGALIGAVRIIPMDAIINALKSHGKPSFFEMNKKALERGTQFAKVLDL